MYNCPVPARTGLLYIYKAISNRKLKTLGLLLSVESPKSSRKPARQLAACTYIFPQGIFGQSTCESSHVTLRTVVGFLLLLEPMKKLKTYKQYKDAAKAHNDSIMAKYGAPEGAKPPADNSFIPSSSDRFYRKFAFTKKTRLETWKPTGRKYPPAGG